MPEEILGPPLSEAALPVTENSASVTSQPPYTGSELLAMRDAQEQAGEPFTVLFTDLDDTLYHVDSPASSHELAVLAERDHIPIIGVTGGDIAYVERRIAEGSFPYLQAVATETGTQIWVLTSTELGERRYRQDLSYEQRMFERGFNRSALVQQADAWMTAVNGTDESFELDFYERELEMKFLDGASVERPRFSIGCHFYASSPETFEALSLAAAEAFSGHSVVISEDSHFSQQADPSDPRRMYCVFIVSTTKAGAVRYLTNTLGIQSGMVAGDSGNDLDMLTHSSRFTGVVVGGAKRELLAAVEKLTVSRRRKGPASSFQTIVLEDGTEITLYIEPRPDRKGAHSILRAAGIMRRLDSIRKSRTARYPDATQSIDLTQPEKHG